MNCPACGSENIDGIDRCENCLAPFRDLDVPRADSAEGLARSVMEDKLSQLEFDETICVAPQTPAIEVARLMKEAHSGCALVLDGEKLVGIFTEHDVLLRMTDQARTRNIDPRLFDHASPDQTREPSMNVDDISGAGIALGDFPLEEIRAEEMQSNETQTEIQNEKNRDRVIGSDLLVGDLMSRDPETLNENDSVASALNKMSLGRYRHLPIKRNDRSYAVASIRSVLKYIAQEDW